jgi:hypothetical protein
LPMISQNEPSPRRPFYQAELRPDLLQTIDQLQRNSERRNK